MLGSDKVLQKLAYNGYGIGGDPLYLDVMKKLKKSKLLLREDIQDYDLLLFICMWPSDPDEI